MTTEERQALQAGLHAREAFTLRRCQILLASADGKTATQIAVPTQTVRNTLRAFAAEGLACLSEKSHRPKRVRPLLAGTQAERLRALLHRSPRDFGKPTSLWTLSLAAEVAFEQGLTERQLSHEAIR
ncbi:helix-turn-helix domain-containing protein [Azotobacter chroococcum]|uniref:helix-turn-helix domain-containing protein n=1 Tax=Azotobacter chroococcum TaxID=353 RepID=UPI001939359B|nr:helix-turn-helix domain-containing protein [Azotobacter chroococcum]